MASKFTASYLPEITATIFGRKKPAMVTVNLTNRCDQRCIYCEIGQGIIEPVKDALTVDDIKWIIDEMSKNGIPKISLCGGEPFLFQGIAEVPLYARSKNISTSITTNGMSVYKLSDNELLSLSECKTEINISIDSFREEIQSLTRGKESALENALKSIKRLQEYKIPVTILCAISRYNFREISAFVRQACELSVRQVLFQPLIYATNYPGQNPVEQKSSLNVPTEHLSILHHELREILAFERHHPIKTNVYRILPWIGHYIAGANSNDGGMFFKKVLSKFYCREIDAIIDISFNGEIQPCGLTNGRITIFSNRQSGLIELWKQATLELKTQLGQIRYPEVCNSCCHHFSRNMIASVMRYPYANRKALMKMMPLFGARLINETSKKFIFRNT